LKANLRGRYQDSNYPQRHKKFRINSTYFLIGLILISSLVIVDKLRFNQQITKPQYRYFSDPNTYLEMPK
ncbi:MAG: hypothetical protein ACKPGN_12145, partial [Dolichospermum sp.]